MIASRSTFLEFWEQTKDPPEVDLDFSRLLGTMPKTCVANSGVVDLPPPDPRLFCGGVAELFLRRSSIREYAAEPVPLLSLSTLLHYAVGVKGYLSAYGYENFPLRTFPSAGGLMPTEIYLITVAVEGLRRGAAYHYNPIPHTLELISEDTRATFAVIDDLVATMPPMFEVRPALAVILSSRYGPVEEKYSTRGSRFVLLDAGIVIENVYLAANALGLGVCGVGGGHDEQTAAALGLDPGADHEAPVAALIMGLPAG